MPGRALTASELEQFRIEGYVIVRQAFEASRIAKLRHAVESMLDRAAAAEDAEGDEPGAPKVSWINKEKRLPERMGDYMTPAKYSPEFTDWLGEDAIPHLEQLITGGQERGVRHCRFQMLAGGDGESYRQGWHRDQRFVDPEGHFGQVCSDAGLAFMGRCVEWNTPLLANDHFFQCVPGSHCRPNSLAEVAVLHQDAAAVDSVPMPGMFTAEMQIGDVCYFDAGMLHRGWNPNGEQRWTMHHVTWGADVSAQAIRPCL